MAGAVAPEHPALGALMEMPADLNEQFREMVTSLRRSQLAVQGELEPLQEVQAPVDARGALLRLHRSLDGLVVQADALLFQMREHGASDSLIGAAESLSDYFWDTRKRIATML